MPDDEDQYLTGLLASLGNSAPEPRFSVERAIADGRFRRRRRRQRASVTGAVAVVAALAVAVPLTLPRDGTPPAPASLPSAGPSVSPSPSPAMPEAPAACRVQALPQPAGTTDSQVVAADPTGRYQAGYAWRGGEWMVAVWDSGRLVDAAKVPGLRPTVVGVNSAGVVAGYTSPMKPGIPGEPPVWTLASGKLSTLPLPPGGTVTMQYRTTGINAAGDVVGYDLSPAQHKTTGQLIVWPADDPAAPRVLAPPTGAALSVPALPAVASIDDQGRVYAAVTPAAAKPGTGPAVPYVWSAAGIPQKLPVPGGFGANRLTERGGRLLGDLAGKGGTLGYGSVDLATGQLTRYPAGLSITSVNRWGWAVGLIDKVAPVAVFAARTVNLLAPATTGATSGSASTINDTGTVIGGQLTSAGRSRAALWTCG